MAVYKQVFISGSISELLEVFHVPVDVSGALEICVGLQLGESLVLEVFHVPVDVSGTLEICVGLQLGESLVLLVFLNELKAKLSGKLCLGQEQKGDDCRAAFSPSSGCILCHEGHGKPYEFFL
jgi:hypothetical protein